MDKETLDLGNELVEKSQVLRKKVQEIREFKEEVDDSAGAEMRASNSAFLYPSKERTFDFLNNWIADLEKEINDFQRRFDNL